MPRILLLGQNAVDMRMGWHILAAILLTVLTNVASAAAEDAKPAPSASASASRKSDPRRIVFDQRSAWNRVIVVDHGNERSLCFGGLDGDTQSTISLRDPKAVPMEYIRHSAGALAFASRRESALIVGLGGGTFPMLLRRSFPAMAIDVVELDPMVRQVAQRYFGLREDAKLRVHVEDGAAFMRRARRRWDIVFLDAYGAGGIPEALASDAFFARVAQRLAPNGLVIANITDTSSTHERAVISRLAKAFSECALQRTPASDNVIVVAGRGLPKDVANALRALDREARLPFPVAPMAESYRPCE